jgi:glyoxylase-like metal-dependent hydrolase (beta-lactamase superfamily II)
MTAEGSHDPAYGRAVEILPGVRRLTARNPGPFTYLGTNCYLVGDDVLTVIDPGPDEPSHLALLREVIGSTPVSHILVTHTHRDHSPAARPLAAATGAVTVAEGPYRPARPRHAGEVAKTGADTLFRPDVALAGGERIATPAGLFEAVATPGHAANHLAFAIPGGPLFSGDHVMGWSTTVVSPPDGSMADYMASLDRLAARPERLYLPGHGAPIADGPARVAELTRHRRAREAAIAAAVAAGADTVPRIVAVVYGALDPRLAGGAALSVLAHLEELVAHGAVATDGDATIDARYRASR